MTKWASVVALSEPSAEKIALGWGSEIVDGNIFDWFMNRADNLLDRHATLHQAIRATVEGENFVLNRGASDGLLPLESVDNQVLSGTEVVTWVDSDAEKIALARTSIVELYDRGDLATVERTFTPAAAGTIVKAVTSGTHVAAIYGTHLEVWERDTGDQVIHHDFGATLRDVAIGGDRVGICGDRNAILSKTAESFSIALASSMGSYDHGADCYALCRVYDTWIVTGADGGGGTNQIVGLSGPMTATLWATDPTVLIAGGEYRNLATDGRIAVCHNGNGGAALLAFSVDSGEELLRAATNAADGASHTFASVVMDCSLAYVTRGDSLIAVDPQWKLAQVWSHTAIGASEMYACSDSDVVWLAIDGGATQVLRSVRGTNRETIWRRVAPSDALPFSQLAIPAGI